MFASRPILWIEGHKSIIVQSTFVEGIVVRYHSMSLNSSVKSNYRNDVTATIMYVNFFRINLTNTFVMLNHYFLLNLDAPCTGFKSKELKLFH